MSNIIRDRILDALTALLDKAVLENDLDTINEVTELLISRRKELLRQLRPTFNPHDSTGPTT
jgi:hypothetical protein